MLYISRHCAGAAAGKAIAGRACQLKYSSNTTPTILLQVPAQQTTIRAEHRPPELHPPPTWPCGILCCARLDGPPLGLELRQLGHVHALGLILALVVQPVLHGRQLRRQRLAVSLGGGGAGGKQEGRVVQQQQQLVLYLENSSVDMLLRHRVGRRPCCTGGKQSTSKLSMHAKH
jgi:hypothetical protein